eukprot:3053872-Pleurochrysis_carterae.AAC.1
MHTISSVLCACVRARARACARARVLWLGQAPQTERAMRERECEAVRLSVDHKPDQLAERSRVEARARLLAPISRARVKSSAAIRGRVLALSDPFQDYVGQTPTKKCVGRPSHTELALHAILLCWECGRLCERPI